MFIYSGTIIPKHFNEIQNGQVEYWNFPVDLVRNYSTHVERSTTRDELTMATNSFIVLIASGEFSYVYARNSRVDAAGYIEVSFRLFVIVPVRGIVAFLAFILHSLEYPVFGGGGGW